MTATKKWPLWSSNAATVLRWSFFILVADQLTKLWILFGLSMREGDRLEITPFFDLLMVWNRGISYGLFQQSDGIGRWLLVVVGLIACAVVWIWANRSQSRWLVIGASFIIGGGIGNTIDRIAYGAVADFASLHAFGFYWYVFNIADVAIVAGFLLLMYEMLWLGSDQNQGRDQGDMS
ncbi:MAG: signal peptidase II [Hyphomicrobiales bacterium]